MCASAGSHMQRWTCAKRSRQKGVAGCARRSAMSTGVNGWISRRWPGAVDAAAVSALMMSRTNPVAATARFYSLCLRERWTSTGLRGQWTGRDDTAAAISEHLRASPEHASSAACIYGCLVPGGLVSVVEVGKRAGTDSRLWARLAGHSVQAPRWLPVGTELVDSAGGRVLSVRQHDAEGLCVRAVRGRPLQLGGELLQPRARGGTLHMARCRRLCTMQAEFARVFSVQWWTVGRTAAFLESDGMLTASSDCRRLKCQTAPSDNADQAVFPPYSPHLLSHRTAAAPPYCGQGGSPN